MTFDPSSDPSRYDMMMMSSTSSFSSSVLLDQVVLDPSTPSVATLDTSRMPALHSLHVTPSSSSSSSASSKSKTSGQQQLADIATGSGDRKLDVLQQMLTRNQLKIKSVDRKDSALYTCIAINNFGRAEYNLQLIVQGIHLLHAFAETFSGCDPHFHSRPSNLTVEGLTFCIRQSCCVFHHPTQNCSPSSVSYPFTATDFYWLSPFTGSRTHQTGADHKLQLARQLFYSLFAHFLPPLCLHPMQYQTCMYVYREGEYFSHSFLDWSPSSIISFVCEENHFSSSFSYFLPPRILLFYFPLKVVEEIMICICLSFQPACHSLSPCRNPEVAVERTIIDIAWKLHTMCT